MKNKILTLSIISSAFLSSCAINTHDYIADFGREFTCVQYNSQIWRDGKFSYRQGEVATYERRGTDLIQDIATYGHCKGDMIRTPESTVSEPKIFRQGAYGPKLSALPEKIGEPETTSAEIVQLGDSEATWNALWAYPLATVGMLAIDLPTLVIGGTAHVLTLPFQQQGDVPNPEIPRVQPVGK